MLYFFIIGITVLLSSCNFTPQASEQQTLKIIHAGSLSYPFHQLVNAFREEYPLVKVQTESIGSVAGARKIIDLNFKCDIYATADYTLIETMLYPSYARWYVPFSTNEITVVFTDNSKYSSEINSLNWVSVLLRPDVRFGRSDPDADPCGYRTLMMWKLTGKSIQGDSLYDKFSKKDLRFIRPKEVDLLALLQTGIVDYVFLYRSVAQQHGLRYLNLPDSINLGNPSLGDYYQKANVQIKGNRPDEIITKQGESIVYAITIPENAPNPTQAELFLNFLLYSEKGRSVMEKAGQPVRLPVTKILLDSIYSSTKQ